MAAVWMGVSEPGAGAALEVGSDLFVSGRGTTWSTVTTQTIHKHTHTEAESRTLYMFRDHTVNTSAITDAQSEFRSDTVCEFV